MINLAYRQGPKEYIDSIDGVRDMKMKQALRLGGHKSINVSFLTAMEFEGAQNVSRSLLKQSVKELITCGKIGHPQTGCWKRARSGAPKIKYEQFQIPKYLTRESSRSTKRSLERSRTLQRKGNSLSSC